METIAEPRGEAFQDKIIQHLEGKVVRKDLTQLVKGNAVVPSYVLEYLLGQYCPTDDPDLIAKGVDKVRAIISEHYVHRDESELTKAKIRRHHSHKVIDRVAVQLNEKRDVYNAKFSNLNVSGVVVADDTINKYPKLLTGGVWCIVDLSYLHTDEKDRSPWIIEKLKPIQMGGFDFEEFAETRKQFTRDEWTDLLMQSIGLNPAHFSDRNKRFQLTRLIPFCERNYNFIELGPKGTGKSHVYSEFSPHGMLISGGDVTKAKLFVNNNTGDIGLVGYWDVVGFDEFAGKDKKVKRDLVDIMKNYMANKSFSRGKDVMSAEASMAFIGNTDRSVPYMLKHSDLFEALPPGYYDPAFIDRLHFYLPGWEVDKLRNEMFTRGYGLIVDYLAEGLHALRKEDYSLRLKRHFQLDNTLTKRDRDGVMKTASGLLKILYPGVECPKDELQDVLEFAIEGRRRVKDHLLRIDETFEEVTFSFSDLETGKEREVETLEFAQYPSLVQQNGTAPAERNETESASEQAGKVASSSRELKHGEHLKIKENQKGVSYRSLFADHLKGAHSIEIIDPYIRRSYQVKNLLNFCAMVLDVLPEGEEVEISLQTCADRETMDEQEESLSELQESLESSPIRFSYEITWEGLHGRYIRTDTGWEITLDRGLDIFQAPDRENSFDLGWVRQEERRCKAFYVTYLKKDE